MSSTIDLRVSRPGGRSKSVAPAFAAIELNASNKDSDPDAVTANSDATTPVHDDEKIMFTQNWLEQKKQEKVEPIRSWYKGFVQKSGAPGDNNTDEQDYWFWVELDGLNFRPSETSIYINQNWTWGEVGLKLYSHGKDTTVPVALERICGPTPVWRVPNMDAKLPLGVQKIYLANVDEPFILALRRDPEEDTPLLIPIRPEDKRTINDLVSGASKSQAWESIAWLPYSHEDHQSADLASQNEIRLYSTVLFVLLNRDPQAYEFRDDRKCQAPLPLQITFLLCQALVDSAPNLKVFYLQGIFLAQALLHLILTLAEAIQKERSTPATDVLLFSRLRSLVNELRSTFEEIQSKADTLLNASLDTSLDNVKDDLMRFFYNLCEEQPGVVAVRHSFEAFKNLIALDNRNQDRLYRGMGIKGPISAHDELAQPTSVLQLQMVGDGHSPGMTLTEGFKASGNPAGLDRPVLRLQTALDSPPATVHENLFSASTTASHSHLENARSTGKPVEDLTGLVTVIGHAPKFTGTYSFIYLGTLRGKMVAIKVLRWVKGKNKRASMDRKVTREQFVWAKLNHPNILPFHGSALEIPELGDTCIFRAFISPWHPAGDAGIFMKRHGPSMNFTSRIRFWQGVVKGVSYLHNLSPPLVHGDLKPGNILIDSYGNARLCDFGFARIMQEENELDGMVTTSEYNGTDRYLAFELVTVASALPTESSDIHALGCLGLEFIFNRKPYENRENKARRMVFIDISRGIPPATRAPNLNPDETAVWDLIEPCWNPKPESRPHALNLLTQTAGVLSKTRVKRFGNTEHWMCQYTVSEEWLYSPPPREIQYANAIWSIAHRGVLYDHHGRFDDAERAEVELLEQRHNTLGRDHEDTISAAEKLALTYYTQGRGDEAEQLQRWVINRRKHLSGAHPHAIRSAANLAVILAEQCRWVHWTEAETLQVEVLERQRALFGAGPRVLKAARGLSATYCERENWSKAEELQLEILEQKNMHVEDAHSETWAAADLASTYHMQGKWSEARKLREEILETRKSIFGNDHPYTILAEESLEATHRAPQEVEAARRANSSWMAEAGEEATHSSSDAGSYSSS